MLRIYFLLFTIQLFCLEAFAQVAASPIPSPAGSPVVDAPPPQWLVDLIMKYPKLAAALVIMGGLRLTIKPLLAFLHQFFQAWGLQNWDDVETSVEKSQPLKWLYFLLDYIGSIKLPVSDKK